MVGGQLNKADTIDLHFWRTPNSSEIATCCEEIGFFHRIVPIDIGAGDQLADKFRTLNPNGKVGAIVDPDGPQGRSIRLFEPGATLIHLADKDRRVFTDTTGRMLRRLAGADIPGGRTGRTRRHYHTVF